MGLKKPKILEKYQHAVDEFVNRAVAEYGDRIERIILFGSVARGEAGDDSDIDILILGDVSLEELVDISFPILLKYGETHLSKGYEKRTFLRFGSKGIFFCTGRFKGRCGVV